MNTLTRHAVRNAVSTVFYVFAIVWILQNVQKVAEAQPEWMIAAGIILLFMVSALITGSLVLWQPAQLLIDGKKHEASRLLVTTGVILVGALLLVWGALAIL